MAKEKDTKNKKHFLKDFKAELKKVIWPTPKQVVNNTIAVIVIVLITALIVFVLDLTFDLLNANGINKLKEKVLKDDNVIENVNTENTINNIENTIEVEGTANTTENVVESGETNNSVESNITE